MKKQIKYIDEIVIRFAGDSGDGMQITGNQYAETSAEMGNDVNTFPDYPSEIRAPEGTLYGVSAFQVNLGSEKVNTPGDQIDVLVAMNASSLKVNIGNVKPNGILILNKAGFTPKYLASAKYETNPIEDHSLTDYQVFAYDINEIINLELEDMEISPKDAKRTKNIWALGLTYWLCSRPIEPTIEWLETKFASKPVMREANIRVLKAGYKFGGIREEFAVQYIIKKKKVKKGTYRNITGNNAVALGLVTAAYRANLPFFLGSYPITPATEILHYISSYKRFGVKHLQAEDEIAGVISAIGAAYGGYLAATTTSGPGLSLKVEALGFACMLELPLIVIDVMRAGPSTGLPTKPEQSDLYLALYGRHGECPLPVLAAHSASNCFEMTIEAARIALKYMTPVILLTDGYLGQGSEPWRIPEIDELPEIDVTFATDPKTFQPYKRDEVTLSRPWAIPGTQGLEHRIGGLEKADITGNVSHDPMNHERMTILRDEKIKRIADDIPLAKVHGDEKGDLLVISWGSTYGAVKTAIDQLHSEGKKVSYVNLKYINPLPKNLGEIVNNFERILIPELNMGQLKHVLEAAFLRPIIGQNKIQGNTFVVEEIKDRILELLKEAV